MSNTQHNQIRFSSTILLITGLLCLWACEKSSSDIPTAPVTLEGLIEEGLEAFAEGDFETAIDRFNEALERDVDPEQSLLAYQGLGWVYTRINKPALAIGNFNFILSVESVLTGKNPIVEQEKTGLSNAYNPTPTVNDTFGVGRWTISLDSSDYLLSISEIKSYSAQYEQVFSIGATVNKIEPGVGLIPLEKASIANIEGTGIGSPLLSAIEFTVAVNPEADSLVNPVADPDSIVTYSDYYINSDRGEVTIKPRYWTISELGTEFKYLEKDYIVRNLNYHEIALADELGEGDKFPVLDKTTYDGGDVYYIKGEFFNTEQGGTYYQADAYAGMAATYLAQEMYEESIRAARTALMINEYMSEDDPDHYPYQRQLYEGDEDIGLWEVYHLLATGLIYVGDYGHALECLEYLNPPGATLPDTESDLFVFDLIEALSEIQKDANWEPPQL